MPSTRRPLAPWALATAALAGQAMASLDSSIVNVGGPAIARDLHMSGPGLQLAIYSYLLVFAVSLVTGARLGARFGYGRLFAAGLSMFTLSSLACGLAVTPAMLVAARMLQGLGAALLVPQVLSLLQTTFDGPRRRRAMSLYGMVLAVGVAAGQVLGGLVVGADLLGAGWRPIFLINVPIGISVLACAAGRLPAGAATGGGGLDLGGAAYLAVAMLALVVPLTFGADAGWPAWSWPLLAAGLLLLTIFARYEARLARRGREPLVDPALLVLRGVRSGLTGIFALHACYGGLLFTTAIYLQHALHQSPLRAGVTFAWYAAGFATASLTWTRLPASWQPRLPVGAFATVSTATGLLAWTLRDAGWPWQATVLLMFAGAAHGAGFGVLVHHVTAGVPATRTAAMSGVLGTVSQLATVTGIALAGTVYLSASSWSRWPAMSVLLVTLAATEVLAGITVGIATRPRSPHSGRLARRAAG
jgi:MFS family permease